MSDGVIDDRARIGWVIVSAIGRQAEAMRKLTNATMQLRQAMSEQGQILEAAKSLAFEADPGLEAAWQAARFRDRSIGWLDVAAERGRQP